MATKKAVKSKKKRKQLIAAKKGFSKTKNNETRAR